MTRGCGKLRAPRMAAGMRLCMGTPTGLRASEHRCWGEPPAACPHDSYRMTVGGEVGDAGNRIYDRLEVSPPPTTGWCGFVPCSTGCRTFKPCAKPQPTRISPICVAPKQRDSHWARRTSSPNLNNLLGRSIAGRAPGRKPASEAYPSRQLNLLRIGIKSPHFPPNSPETIKRLRSAIARVPHAVASSCLCERPSSVHLGESPVS